MTMTRLVINRSFLIAGCSSLLLPIIMLLVARRLKNSGYEIDKEETNIAMRAEEGFVTISRKKIAAPGAKKRGRTTRQQKREPVRMVPQDDCRSSVICGIDAQRSKSK